MEFVTYVLFSEKHNIHYTGFTSNLVARFYSHNITSNKGFTKKIQTLEGDLCEISSF